MEVRFTDHVIREGLSLFVQLEERKIEGMVAKRILASMSAAEPPSG